MAQLRTTSMDKETVARVAPEDEIIVNNLNPNFDFTKQAISASIDYWINTKKVLIGDYAYHLYDFLVLNKILLPTREDILQSFAIEKEAYLKRLFDYKHTMSKAGYEYNVDLVNKDQVERVKQMAKVRILRDRMQQNPIDLEKIKDLL